MQQALQKLKDNKLHEALTYFEKHQPFEESAKILINYSQSQDIRVKEFIYKWILHYAQSPNIKLDVYNFLGCLTQEPNKQVELFNEALKLTVAYDLNPSTTLINLSCAYSKLKQHDKALSTALQSISCSVGKQLVLAYHNAAVEYQTLKQDAQSLQFHQKAYQYCRAQFGDEDPLTKKMEKYIFKQTIKKVPVPAQGQFRLRSSSRHSEHSKSFYYKRQAQRDASNSNSLNSVNQTVSFVRQSFTQEYENQFDNFVQNDFDLQKLEGTIETQRQIRLNFILSVHQQNIWQLERKKANRLSVHINLSQDSIQNIDNQLSKTQDFINFENQNPDGKFDSMIPLAAPQEDLTQDDQELIIKQIQGFDNQNNNYTGISFANQETFENTFEYKNKHNRATLKIQRWYRKQFEINKIKNQTIRLKNQQSAAIKIQKNYKKHRQQKFNQYAKLEKQKEKSFELIRDFKYENNEKKYFRIIGVYQEEGMLYKFIEQIDKLNKKRQLKFSQFFTYNELKFKYNHFDDFLVHKKMPQHIIYIANRQRRRLNYQEICKLFYFQNKQIQLYGVTDYQFEINENDSIYQINQIMKRSFNLPRMKLSSLLKLQSLLKSYLAKKRSELLKNQIYKSKRFIEQISGEYFMIIMKSENHLQFYNVKTKRYCDNEITVPICVMNFYGAITRKNCAEIFQITEKHAHFSEDAQYLIDKEERSKQKVDPNVVEKAAIKLQRAVRQKIIFFNEKIIKYKTRAKQSKHQIILFTLRKTFLYKNQYQIILSAYGEIVNDHQWLVINGGIISKDHLIPTIQPSCQRLFKNLEDTDFLQVAKIILEELQFTQNNHKIQLLCNSVEEVYGFLIQREYNKFKDSLKDAENKDPTLEGRNFLSRQILCQRYLLNRFEIQDRPQDVCYFYDPATYSLNYIKNTFVQKMYNRFTKIRDNKIINSINHYVNSFPSMNQYEWIADPEELMNIKLEKSARIVQKCFRMLKFRIVIHSRCELRRKRKAAMIEAQKGAIKLYYYDEIQIVQPFTTTQILQRRGEVPIILHIMEIDEEIYEWILILPYYDIVVTVYSQPRRFYQIKYLDYTNHYLEMILAGPIDKLQSYFRSAIVQYHPTEKYEFIRELREQFSRKVVRIVRLKLFFKKIKEIPATKKFLIRSFVNEFYVQINYFYNKHEQKIIIFLSKDTHKRKYELELFYLDCLFGKYHQQKYLDRENFIKLLTLNENKGYHKYRRLLLPLINILHCYSTINFELEINYTYNDYEFPLQENNIEKYRTASQACNLSWTESVQRFLPSIISLQNKWRLYHQKRRYQFMLFKQMKMKIKMLSKKGVVADKTYLRRKDISDDTQSDIMYLCNIFQSNSDQIINVRVELYSYKGKQQQELFNIFQIEPRLTLMNDTISQYVLKNIFIENNKIILKQKYENKFDIKEQIQRPPLKLQTKKPSSPKLIYHQNRQYSQGKFVYDAIHSGEAPLNNSMAKQNTIQINIDLKEIKMQYPGINYKNKNSLPQLTEQLISGLKIDKAHVLSKQLYRKNGIRINGDCQHSEQDDQLTIKTNSQQQNTLLLRFTQFFKNKRYMIMISQLDIPIDSYERLDSTYEPYHSFIQVQANQSITNKKTIWQMNYQQAIDITNQSNAKDIAKTIEQNVLILDNKFIYVVDHKAIDFQNVMMLKRHTINLIQKMIKNKKFMKLRKQFELEVKQLKDSENPFWSNIIYYGINQFKSEDYFITLIIERKQYLVLSWNIRNYQRYTLTMFKNKGFHEQLENIRFINENLEL